MVSSLTSRLHHAIREYGAANMLLFALHRFLRRFRHDAVFERLYIVDQSVPPVPPFPPRRGAQLEVRSIAPSDPALEMFARDPCDLAERYVQSASCLGVFREGVLLGWLWLVPGVFQNFEHPLTFNMRPADSTAWDFDVYVRPEARLSAAFARLWDAAFQALRDIGVTHTLSAISAYNPASLRAHGRLGSRAIGSILIIRLGRFQAVCSRRFPPRLQWSFRRDFHARLLVDISGTQSAVSKRPS